MAARPTLILRQLPPFGFVPIEYGSGVVRIDHLAKEPVATSLATCESELRDYVWPQFDPLKREWIGAAARSAIRVSEEDLSLIQLMQGNLWLPIASPVPAPASNIRLFRDEDVPADELQCGVINGAFKSGATVFEYVPADKGKLAEILAIDMSGGEHRRLAVAALLHLKEAFQRPRPHQTAYLLGHPTYAYRRASTAATPSIPSGHSFEALVSGTIAYVKNLAAMPPGAISSFQQYLVDVGDRRVFAGVHYPSDNIASWYCALSICEALFPATQIDTARDFMWRCIRERSVVYRTLLRDASALPALRSRLDWLHSRVRRFGLQVV